MTTVRYIAKKQFKYGKKTYRPGDDWTPDGGRFDEAIISNGLVSVERVQEPVKAPAVKRNGTKG